MSPGTWLGERNFGRAVPSVAAVALLAGVVITGVVGGFGGDDAGGSGTTGSDAASPTIPTTTSTTTTLPPTTTTAPKTSLGSSLSKGMQGSEVERLQRRLTDLGFQPGPIDGQFGNLTQMAIWAYEKLVVGAPFRDPSGVVTPQMWLDLQDPLPVIPRRVDDGQHTEIYLPQQVLVVFNANRPVFISHISSGELAPPGDDFTEGADWCEEVTIDPGERGNEEGTEPLKKGVCGNSWTPGGVYEFYRKHEGTRESRLGGMLNPVYFNYGIAVHGGFEVPLQPASHGCIRIPNAISETFFQLVSTGQKVFVFDGVEEPEDYGSPPGWFDRDDPNYTTTTTATTSPPTTAAPATTATATTPATVAPRPATTTEPPRPATTPKPATTTPRPTTTTTTTTTTTAVPAPPTT